MICNPHWRSKLQFTLWFVLWLHCKCIMTIRSRAWAVPHAKKWFFANKNHTNAVGVAKVPVGSLCSDCSFVIVCEAAAGSVSIVTD